LAAASILETTEPSTTPSLNGAQTSSSATADAENTDKTSPKNMFLTLFITTPVAISRNLYIREF
jgi:hypothetical protein